MLIDIIVSALLVAGGFFGLVGAWGLVRLPDAMTRLHAPTKSATLGVGAVLLASMVWMPAQTGQATWHELVIVLFLFLTAPITGYMIAKATLHRQWRQQDLPAPGGETPWATYAAPRDDTQDTKKGR